MDKNAYAERLLQPERLYSALDIANRPSTNEPNDLFQTLRKTARSRETPGRFQVIPR